ncbi:FAD-dependent oxidoreductase [Streptomyces sp. TBY4]|uniref:FAD-dependent oxidoreductase n=1 Tax=Streptomyces sp. TBY4 TaxID=2962030 RepID=UPI0020B75CF5|nr:FAD-dependent oxidoreductase [Streptomyces sp. TBY4]MCP3753962.1 FAD-dependent oxidoreductase [Streptomyces sp. TBY4]
MKVVVIGGVAAGMSAAARLRRLDEEAEIVVLERGGYVSFANCGLPYHLGGVIEEREDLLLHTPDTLARRFALDVRVRSEVLSVDREAQLVRVRDLADGRLYEESWDRLVLAPGARPVVPPVPGIERAHTLRDIADLDGILAALAGGARTAVVIGGGFIGIEAAENLRHRGLATTLVEAAPQVLPPLDPEMAQPAAAELRAHGVDLRLGGSAVRVLPREVELADGDRVPADLVLLAVGVRPETALAVTAGLELGPHGGIRVDGALRTSDPRILAVGDAAEKAYAPGGGTRLIPLANLANRHGRIAADTLAGRTVTAVPAQGTAIVQVFGLTAAATGRAEKELRREGRPYRALHLHGGSHAGYYPGAAPLSLKLLFDPQSLRILGAQAVGSDGVDKRIDVLATAMAAGLPVTALADLELAYAPPYGSAKDPVNLLGYLADNLLTGTTPTVQWDAGDGGHGLPVDVRTKAEHERGHLPGSVNIPLDELRDRVGELPADRPLTVYCQGGQRAHTAVRLLRNLGLDAANLDGGWLTWSAGTAAAAA